MSHWTDPLKALQQPQEEADNTKAFVKVLSFVPESKGQQLGIAKVRFFDCLVLTGIRLYSGAQGHFLGMPARKKDEAFEDIAFLTTREMREMVTALVVEASEKARTTEAACR